MISGNCPYDKCGKPIVNFLADGDLPKLEKVNCEHCEEWYWLFHSRIESYAMTNDEFNRKFIIDEETKSVMVKE